jgi:hypothetical protein
VEVFVVAVALTLEPVPAASVMLDTARVLFDALRVQFNAVIVLFNAAFVLFDAACVLFNAASVALHTAQCSQCPLPVCFFFSPFGFAVEIATPDEAVADPCLPL